MDKSTHRSRSQVFITSLESFDLVYDVKESTVVSRFRSSKLYSWKPNALTARRDGNHPALGGAGDAPLA